MMRRRERHSTLAGSVIVITGAASGIGRALALACAERGATLALSDVNDRELNTLSSELALRGVTAERFLLEQVDVQSREQMLAWAARVAERLGHAEVVVNCAGVSLHCPLDETSVEDFEWVMATNFWGVVHGTQAFLPQLIRRGRAQLINVSSVFGLAAFPGMGAYAASKFAVRGFTEALAIELSITHPSVTVTCVHPGGIKTPLVRRGRVRGQGPLAGTAEAVSAGFERHLARTSAEKCAADIIRVILRPRSRALVGADARLIDWGVRLFPSLYKRVLAWAVRRRGDPRGRFSL